MYKLFRRDPAFFLKYNATSILLLLLTAGLLFHYWSALPFQAGSLLLLLCLLPLALPNLWSILGSASLLVLISLATGSLAFAVSDWFWLLLGCLVGLQSAYLMHNAAHESIKPAWLNRLVGELCGLQQLMGFPGWAVPHIIHHQYPDDPEKDPHPPEHLSFRQYLGRMLPSMARVAKNSYFELWGDNAQTRRYWRLTLSTSMLARYLRAVVLLLLLGTKLFVVCYMVSKLVNLLMYMHFNYYTHRPTQAGQMEILNLDHNLYYWFMNATMPGVYYHKNHHAKPSLFDARKLDKVVDEPLISWSYPAAAKQEEVV
jgi:fatty-acid desaturase